jgi:beta-1,2-mannobiose phosphorylase / 1,2-beta-oligomannan phosphorylase
MVFNMATASLIVGRNPVMVADLDWERGDAVMTPCVIELENSALRMYYSGGQWYEPDAIGVAHSYDGGTTWVKHGDPIFNPDPTSPFDNYKVTAPHVLFHDGWYYLFYCGFRGSYQFIRD